MNLSNLGIKLILLQLRSLLIHITLLMPTSFTSTKKGNVAKQNNFQKEQSLFRNIIRLYMFLKKIKRGQYDLVLANQSMTPFPVLFSMVSAKCVYYIQAYEPALYRQFDGKKYLLLSVLSKLSYSLPFTKIVNSPLLLNYKGIKTNNMALPGIDLDNFSPNKNYLDKPEEIKVIGTIGRTEKYKGTSYVIQAFNKIRMSNPTAELHIAFGDENLHNPRNGIFVSRPDGDVQLAQFYRSLDLYISAGTIEHGSVHYPVIEAMACGVAVITTPYYPANGDNSWIIESESVESIIDAFDKVHTSNPEEYSKKVTNAFEAIQQFSWGRVSHEMLRIFQNELD